MARRPVGRDYTARLVGGIGTRAVLGIAAAAAAAALVLATPAPSAVRSCNVAGSKTVRTTAFARIYYDSHGRPWSCYRLTGRRTVLDSQVDRFYTPGDAHLGLVRISKRILGYTWIDPGIPAVYVHSVDMRTARFKHRTEIEPLVIIDPTAVSVPQIVVADSGSLAWIQKVEGVYSVYRFDRHGRRALTGAGTTSRITSLRLSGSRLTWRQAGRLRSSRLV
jgi:hypothetical protein